jgi:pyruvate kinase
LLKLSALTPKDRSDLDAVLEAGVDWVALSFVQRADDVAEVKKIARGRALIMAKIEKPQAVERLDAILEVADALMVARGDLGVEMPIERVPGIQKRITRLARRFGKPVVVATQMLESMITAPIPTRAEVSDVANAVLDGTDAVMLSAETAAGQYPLETVQAVHRVVMEAEKEYIKLEHAEKTEQVFLKTDETIAAAAIYTAKHLKVKAIAALTQSGNAARWLSRADAEVPIYALSPDKLARRKLTLHRGVYPFPIEQGNKNKDEILQEMEQVLLQQKMVSPGDTVLLTFGEPIGSPGGTNTLKIVKIGPILAK